jgi:uncharacterized protein
MLYKINEIGEEGLSLKLPLSADWLKTECPDLEAVVAKEGLTFKGQLLQQGDDVFLNGTLAGGLEGVCARCLERARVSLRVPVQVTFVAKDAKREGDDEDEDDEEDGDIAHFDGTQIDLGPELREQILLAFPISPLCREACAGLCPTCGGNRNKVPCDCASRQVSTHTKLGEALGKLKM